MRIALAFLLLAGSAQAAIIPLGSRVHMEANSLAFAAHDVVHDFDSTTFNGTPALPFTHSVAATSKSPAATGTATTDVSLRATADGFEIMSTLANVASGPLGFGQSVSQTSIFFELTEPMAATFSANLALGVATLNRANASLEPTAHLLFADSDSTQTISLPVGIYQLYQNTSGSGISVTSIRFAQAVPEPSTLVLAACGAICAGFWLVHFRRDG